MASWIEQLPGGKSVRYGTGEFVARPDQNENRVFVLEQGRARIVMIGSAREQTLGYLNVGGIFVSHTPTWIEALEPTSIVQWPISELRSLISQQPDVAIIALREIGKLMQHALSLIEDLSFRSVEERLARYLVREASLNSESVVCFKDNTEALASLLGTSRQTLSTLLNRFQREGIIRKIDRKQFQLIEINYLSALGNQLSAR